MSWFCCRWSTGKVTKLLALVQHYIIPLHTSKDTNSKRKMIVKPCTRKCLEIWQLLENKWCSNRVQTQKIHVLSDFCCHVRRQRQHTYTNRDPLRFPTRQLQRSQQRHLEWNWVYSANPNLLAWTIVLKVNNERFKRIPLHILHTPCTHDDSHKFGTPSTFRQLPV